MAGIEKSMHGTLIIDDVKPITLLTLLKLLYSELNARTEISRHECEEYS
jgi:hypothetical protein